MLHLVLLLLVGTIFAEKPDDCPQDHEENTIVPGIKEDKCDMPEIIENSPLDDCQMDRCKNASLDATSVGLKCGTKHGDKCRSKGTCAYRIISCPRTFPQAQAFCRCHRGSLSSIHNHCVNSYVRLLAQRTFGNRFGFVWIGVYKNCNSNQYVNADGSRLNYTKWAYGYPKRCGTWCTALNLANGQWYNFNCCYRLPFVCTY
ncbi:bone marrow proteoglycan-like [Anomaloglossus baeobatrachus]|uniref:bone marrow proteoglycan-like n=1 Tax=Anomaloglossus baeobatrachus TaxID=238106 RepID=UPI003F4FB637